MSDSQDCFKFVLKMYHNIFTNIVQHFMDFAQVVKKWWIVAFLFYCLCIRDFIDIYVYSTLTIANRALWMLQALGLFPSIENAPCRLNKIAQTDMIRVKDAQSSPFQYPRCKRLHTSSQTSPPCKLKLSFSPPKIKNEETQTEEMRYKLPGREPEKSPAILKREAEIPRKETLVPSTYSQTPLCNINLSVTPTVETRVKETNLSPEERSFLKSKWQSWKLKQYIRKLKRQSIFLNCPSSYEAFASSEDVTFSEWSPEDHNKKILEEPDTPKRYGYWSPEHHNKKILEDPDTPKRYGCCNSLITKLRSQLQQASDFPVVSFKRF